MSRSFSVVVLISTVVWAFRPLHADLRWGPPEDHEVRSPNGNYVARITVMPPGTTVYALKERREVEEWSMEGFHRKVHLANDGQHLVIAYEDLVLRSESAADESPDLVARNLRDSIHAWGPATYSPNMVMLQFVERGRIVHELTLHELMPDLSKMIKTVSSWHWGEASPGLNNRGEFLVQTADYRKLHFDVKTARLVRVDTMYRPWLRDFMWPPYRHAVLALMAGIIIGTVFRGRVRPALLTSIALSIALLVFALWIGESFATGNYTFAPTLAALYLVPSTLAVIILGFLWRGAAELMKKSYRN